MDFRETHTQRNFEAGVTAPAQTEGSLAEQLGQSVPGAQSPILDSSSQPFSTPTTLPTGGFTEVNVDNCGLEFASEWRPTMATPSYIGETSMLLEYLKRQERLHRVTMPIKACGIDPILFENVTMLDLPEQGAGKAAPQMFEIPTKHDEGEPASAYELIKVDGNLYLSCVTECLDKDYLNSIIAEATSAVKATGKYIFQMVGFKKLALEEGKTEGRLLDTLRLNSYEMSALISYMNQFEGLNIVYQVIDGKQCICFNR